MSKFKGSEQMYSKVHFVLEGVQDNKDHLQDIGNRVQDGEGK